MAATNSTDSKKLTHCTPIIVFYMIPSIYFILSVAPLPVAAIKTHHLYRSNMKAQKMKVTFKRSICVTRLLPITVFR